MNLRPSHNFGARGITLLEVVAASAILAITVTAISSALANSMMGNRQSGEFLAVQMAARRKLEEISACRFEDLVSRYQPGGTMGNVFDVYLAEQGSGQTNKLAGLPNAQGVPQPAGEVIVIANEGAPASSYGRDLDPLDGKPDGCAFQGIPMDLNGNGTTTDGQVWGSTPATRTAICFPVGVVIRWPGVRANERYELWTIVSRY
jgi:type II secretory pathway pseudopilin PulG